MILQVDDRGGNVYLVGTPKACEWVLKQAKYQLIGGEIHADSSKPAPIEATIVLERLDELGFELISVQHQHDRCLRTKYWFQHKGLVIDLDGEYVSKQMIYR